MKILISGTPGTGKTTIAEKLSIKLDYELIQLNEIVNDGQFYYNIDKNDGAKTVKMNNLENYINNEIIGHENVIIEGHLGCDLNLDVDIVIILRTNPLELTKRLKKRKYNTEKINDNITCETLDYCSLKSEKYYDQIFDVDTTDRTVLGCVKKIIQIIKGKDKGDVIDWADELYDTEVKLS